MVGRRNPRKAEAVTVVTDWRPSRPRPKPFPRDVNLRAWLIWWLIGVKLPPTVQRAINHRLLDLLQKKHRPLSPLQEALEEVRLLERLPGWNPTHACNEVARIRGLNADTLRRSRFRQKAKAKPVPKAP
jgi:hypothetical protein